MLKLNGPLSGGGDVHDFLFAPDSRSLAYRADAAVIAEHELFAVPIQGGAVRALSGPLPAHGGVLDFAFAGPAVVFSAEQELDQTVELYLGFLGRPIRRAR